MADYMVDNLVIKITATASQASAVFANLRNIVKSGNNELVKMGLQVRKLKVDTKGNIAYEFEKINKSARSATGGINGINTSLGKIGGFLGGLISARFIISQLGKAFNEMKNFAENYNLFVVSMGELKDEAVEFQNAMNQALGTNMSQTMRYQGFFQNLTNALGATNRQAFEMSKTLTMLTYDMASLFNWSPDVAFQRLQAGVVGQTKPLRYAGVDVTQQTIEPILGELGIQSSVKDLTQYQKVMLRMIAILRQTTNAQGDFARTIESPANQIRVMNDQIKELYRWIGGTFIGLISKALPYINGFIMALVELFKAISYLFGFTEEDFNFMNGTDDTGLPEIEQEAEGANGAVKKLLGSLRKFDEINNISMRGGDGGGFGGGITDDKLWNELKSQMGYFDESFKNIKTKAVEIKEKIMEWLGVFFELNKEDGEVVGFTGKLTTIGELVGIFVGAWVVASAIIAIAKVATAIGTITTALTGGAVFTGGVVAGGALGATLALLLALGGLTIWAGVTLGNKFLDWLDDVITKAETTTEELGFMEEAVIDLLKVLGMYDDFLAKFGFDPYNLDTATGSAGNGFGGDGGGRWGSEDIPDINRPMYGGKMKEVKIDYKALPTNLPNQTIVVQIDKDVVTKKVIDNSLDYTNKTGQTGYNW